MILQLEIDECVQKDAPFKVLLPDMLSGPTGCELLSLVFNGRGHDASQITLALGTAAAYPRACQALGAMLSKGALNPADITVLFKMFSSMDPPPVELVKNHFSFFVVSIKCCYFKRSSCF